MTVGSASLETILQIAVPLALVVSLALRFFYLHRVRRSMLRPVEASAAPNREALPVPPTVTASAHPRVRRLEILPAAAPARDAIRAAWRGPWVAVAVHVVAGLVYALSMTLVWAWLADSGYSLDGILLFTLFFGWPIVIVIGLVATVTWRAVAVVVLIYAVLFFVGVTWLTRGREIVFSQMALLWWNQNGIGTLLVLASLARPIKAMGPIVVALMMAATAGVFAMAELMSDQNALEGIALIAEYLGFSGRLGGLAAGLILLGLAALVATLVAYIALRGVGWLYKRQWISDQSLQVDAVWLIFALVHAPLQQPLVGLAAFLMYELVARLGLHLFCPAGNAANGRPPRLLLLRVFSLGSRSESLFRAFSLLWRYVGSVRMITGPDLANATVEPHEFLDFLAGRLQRRFISGPAALEQRLAESPLQRDPDCRFRVASFFCYADTWQAVLRRLARESDLVLMDLRGFNSTNKGCIFELNELLDTVRLDRLLLVVDDTTDEVFLTEVLQQGWAQISANSPNLADAGPCVRLYRLHGAGARGIERLVASIGAHRSSEATAAA